MLAFSGAAFSYNSQEININTADARTISKSLNGIGLKKAEAIVAWRTEHGTFTETSSIEQVKGIGRKTVEKNKEFIQY
ncbi:MAG: helix-hairpin-helix domain-containing protein [gamma proteobacterium symbiont of Taylorina sp.]|nr:helix-hairpin-helix domain-containing protein [gamma proteobacterium symbiont of Taylorina sp.]